MSIIPEHFKLVFFLPLPHLCIFLSLNFILIFVGLSLHGLFFKSNFGYMLLYKHDSAPYDINNFKFEFLDI